VGSKPDDLNEEETAMRISKITPCLWFDKQAEQAAKFYVGIFRNSRIKGISRYGDVGQEIHGGKPGSVLTVEFELAGQSFTALNGGPIFKFSEAVSLQVACATQAEIDYYWKRLSAGGDPKARQCGWLKDKYGLSWQVVPSAMQKMMTDPDRAKTDRVMAALLKMKKLDIARLKKAYAG
jgi:predicted 3-demethylubiquinone-9 3-methyltransferase (glyoxalase superfamily)